MNKTELIRAVYQGMSDESYAQITITDVTRAVDAVFDAISASLQRGESVTIRGFGSFVTRDRGQRVCVAPGGSRVSVPPRRSAVFRAGATLKSALNPR